MKRLLFLIQYIIRTRTIGPIMPMSKYLDEKMIDIINFSNAKYIVEYGQVMAYLLIRLSIEERGHCYFTYRV
jgi:phospholipid N-methyltransferase